MTIMRKVRKEDLAIIVHLLDDASLPTAGVEEYFTNFFVAEDGGNVVGAIGLEVYGEVGLLRSAVVRSDLQRRGIGKLLTNALMAEARHLGIKQLILLTTTAADYFAVKGFRKILRSDVKGPVTASAEFTGACPASATCMELRLE